MRFNSKSYVNPFPKLFLDKNQDEKVLHTNRNNHIIHLVKSLNGNANLKEKENYNKIREYINWTLSKNINGENIWINNGKIILSKNEIEKIINTPEEKIKNESFLKRRIWVNNYIQQVISDQIIDNPVLVVSRNNI